MVQRSYHSTLELPLAPLASLLATGPAQLWDSLEYLGTSGRRVFRPAPIQGAAHETTQAASCKKIPTQDRARFWKAFMHPDAPRLLADSGGRRIGSSKFAFGGLGRSSRPSKPKQHLL